MKFCDYSKIDCYALNRKQLLSLWFLNLRVMYRILFVASVGLVGASEQAWTIGSDGFSRANVLVPSVGIYHGAYADFGALEDEVSATKIQAFEKLAGKKLTWAYFSNHWLKGEMEFPTANVEACKAAKVIPYIRLLPWSEVKQWQQDPIFKMDRFLNGDFDQQLRRWARQAIKANTPMILEFGPEVNGEWFSWNGRWQGSGPGATADSSTNSKKAPVMSDGYGDPEWPDGPEKFRDTYRRLIELFREEGADQITWVLHLDVNGTPVGGWNSPRFYDPGPDWIDWIGLSVFGPQVPTDPWDPFPNQMRRFQKSLMELQYENGKAPRRPRPVLISEYAAIEDQSSSKRKADWITRTLNSLAFGMFKDVRGLTYWHSPGWLADGSGNFRIDSSKESLAAYRKGIQDRAFVVTPVFEGR